MLYYLGCNHMRFTVADHRTKDIRRFCIKDAPYEVQQQLDSLVREKAVTFFPMVLVCTTPLEVPGWTALGAFLRLKFRHPNLEHNYRWDVRKVPL